MNLLFKKKVNLSIRLRIALSFLLFVFLFAVNGVVVMSIVFITRSKALHIATVIDPSLRQLDDFHDMVVNSKMYATNWVFFGARQEDKDSLQRIHNGQYHRLKTNLVQLSGKWISQKNLDSLQALFAGFEEVLMEEKKVMDLLHSSGDYANPSRKLLAQKIIEDKIIPSANAVGHSTFTLMAMVREVKAGQADILEASFKKLWVIILVLLINILFLGFILSKYLTGIIVKPINKIRTIVDGLASGVTDKINHHYGQNEIGKMVSAVNNLSDKLKYTAAFAQKIGERDFDLPFHPLGEKDTLGKALLTMRDNLKFVDESLNEAQHIAKMGNWQWDIRSNKVFWSDELYNIFEKEHSSFIPSFDSFAGCVHPEDREFAVNRIKQSLTDLLPFSYECRIVNDNGKIKKIFIQGRVTVDENSQSAKMFGIAQDITQQDQQRQELQQTIERFHNLSKATNDSIWDWNLVTDTVWWNDNFYEVFGYNSANGAPAVGEWILKMHPDDRTKIVDKLKEIRHSNISTWQDELRYLKKDGSFGIALNRAFVFRDDKGRPVRVMGAIQDITERRKAVQQIADSERRYRQIVETAQEGIWLIDENDRTVFVNRKMCELLGYQQEEMIGRKSYDFKEESERQNDVAKIENRKKGISDQYETSYITKSGRRLWVSVSANPVFDDGGNYKGALGMLTDITQRKLQEELLKKSEADLESKNKELERTNIELEQFAYIASHDLQEPLRTVSSFADQLQKQYKDKLDDIGRKYLYFMQQGTERMKTLIKDLLEYSRIGRGQELKPVDCNEVVDMVIADLNTAIQESNVDIKTGKLPVINGYTTEMKQLFQNLVVNAIKFRRKGVPPKICISAQPINGGWEVSVSDNGIGLDEKHAERIFVIFQRLHTRSEYEGSGIGLSHCRKIVELHGGHIWVRSKPGEGSTFHFTILENHS